MLNLFTGKNLKTKQIDLLRDIKRHGGFRKGAGRPRKDKSLQLHQTRADFKSTQPLHVNVKLVKGLPTLRSKERFKLIKQAVSKAREKGLRIIHFSIQSNHIHFLIESKNKGELAKGMQSFCTSLARSLNFKLKRTGQVFKDRYHLHILKTPREVKNALVYIFQNFAKHTKRPNRFDPYSTLLCFDAKIKLGLIKVNTHSIFQSKAGREEFKKSLTEMLSDPRTWLIRVGWQKVF